MAVNIGGANFLNTLKFLSVKLVVHAENLPDDAFVYLKQEFRQHSGLFAEEMACLYECFKSEKDYEKLIEKLQHLEQKAYYSNLNNDYPNQDERDRTNHIINVFKSKNGGNEDTVELMLYL